MFIFVTLYFSICVVSIFARVLGSLAALSTLQWHRSWKTHIGPSITTGCIGGVALRGQSNHFNGFWNVDLKVSHMNKHPVVLEARVLQVSSTD
ncbi:hypothetical protein BKA56DRAFT_275556 [Ilyonectria sp. MPI-CAGE-AT-0026]|nr:hypothetical protein BKA56DRAFT_275556 [Ilyonectria sp. MPI-CAGE-AT-0026]